jgi:arylsulfatase A-like enzyme
LPDAKNVAHAVNELDRLSKQDNPFFLAVGLHRPHLPFRAPKKFWDKYDPKSVPAPKTTKQQLGAPDWAVVAWEIWNYDNLPPKPGPMPKAEGEQLRHGYLAAISFVDGLVGQLLDKLSALDLDKNTVVVVWGDHGFKLGDHGGWSKHSNVELDIHIPLMIRVPGMKASGKRTKALVETVDIYPTLMDVAGLDQPHELEGISLLPLTNEPNQEWKEAVFAQFPRYAKHQALMGETVRTDRYRYTAWVGVRSGKIIAQELYDHKINSTESVNLAENSDYINDLKYHEKLRIMGWKNIHNEMNKKISKNLIN